MKILWFTWKDHAHPAAGGAEIVLMELAHRLTAEGHEVTLLTCGYQGSSQDEMYEGIHIIRVGNNRYIHPFQALIYYLRHLRNKFDIVIEVVNTAPYFGVFFGRRSQRFLFYHQLAREIWFHETRPPLSQFGFYVIEPLATRMLAKAGVPTITISESTKQDLVRYGFRPETITIISEAIPITPVADLQSIHKATAPTIISFGTIRAMKRTKHQITAFEVAKHTIPDLRLVIAGMAEGPYGQETLERIKLSQFAKDITYVGKVSNVEKIKLMQQAHITLQTSLKEGWGLTVSEAASQGTPAVVYDVDGLRDSVQHGHTGIITAPNPNALAVGIIRLLGQPKLYARLQRAGWEWSKLLTFEHMYQDFKASIGLDGADQDASAIPELNELGAQL